MAVRYYIFSLVTLIITYFFSGCKTINQDKSEAKELSLALEHKPSAFYACDVSDYYTAIVLNQCMEGLVTLDPKDLSIKPQLAERWQISSDKRTYTFTLRKGVYFHEHELFEEEEDRLLTAEDVKETIRFACSKSCNEEGSNAYHLIFKESLIGATDYFEGKAKDIAGLRIEKNKVIFQLSAEDPNFLYKLTHVSASINAIETLKSKKCFIGTGPFQFDQYNTDSTSLHLMKNTAYYEKDKQGVVLPYLDGVTFIFGLNKTNQLQAFNDQETDIIIGLPPKKITEMLEGKIRDFNSIPPKLIMKDNPLLRTNYYFFNMQDPRFNDSRVRQAFNLAVNKEKIGLDVLKNQYNELGMFGITPPVKRVLKGYNFESIKQSSYQYNPQRAQELLREAGYPNGEGFGNVTLRIGIHEIHEKVAEEFVRQIASNLNININIDASSFGIKESDANFGRGDIFASSWTADYLTPETFLMNFYGKTVPSNTSKPSFINQARYINAKFDDFFTKGHQQQKTSEALKYFNMAEQELMKNPPLIPIWYSGEIQIIHSYIRNLHFNALGYFQFKSVKKEPLTKEEYTKQQNSNR